MFSRIFSYINFLSKSKNQHGVHSPFVFNLITQCFYDKHTKPDYSILNNYRKDLLSNKKEISVSDFGAGSKIFSSNLRKIAKIAKHAGISKKRGELLFRIVQYFQPKNTLEVGTSLGLSTSAISIAKKDNTLITLEGCNQTAGVAKKMFHKYGLQNVKVITGNFNLTYPKAIKNEIFDFIYFDGNHTKEATLSYFYNCLNSIHNDSIVIFDDIHWSREMEEAWKEIKNHKKVTVTIDTFQWGIVFFRKEQVKEHFIIRV
ncbi:class I SAM-dependent methyltransferase [Pseudotenacibaculum sp. MALMAid0570]|uniref:O-methyltransferase n=1 Tax=Pseudotenacibaculum sp. MALMAid0570 TaxID=3143938 RepID=UPI0032DFD751